jgi:hypothetical protein
MFVNVHHKTPRALGGTDDRNNLVTLCAGCHDALHAAAYKLRNPKNTVSAVRDHLLLIFKENAKAIDNCFELAKLVRNAEIQIGESTGDIKREYQATTTLPYNAKKALTILCKELRMSQEHFIRELIIKELKKKFTHL